MKISPLSARRHRAIGATHSAGRCSPSVPPSSIHSEADRPQGFLASPNISQRRGESSSCLRSRACRSSPRVMALPHHTHHGDGSGLSLDDVLGDFHSFLDHVLEKIEDGLVKGRQIDHICYRVETEELYAATKADLLRLGSLLTESLIGGRPISIIRLNEPIQHGPYVIPCVELPSPKPGSAYATGLEHIEVVIGDPEDSCVNNRSKLEAFMAAHPEWEFDTRAIGKEINADVSISLSIESPGNAASVKFHVRPIDEVIAFERSQGLC